MKKFLIFSTILFIFMAVYINDSVSNTNLFDKTYLVKSDNKDIYIAKDNKWEKFYIKGVNLDSSKPGSFSSDNSVTKEEYTRWISLIYDMGANCIRVPDLMGHEFYKALEEFNKDKENPIYVMQGIYFDEGYLKDGYDPQNKNLTELFKSNIKLVIDSVHGNPFNYNKPEILKFYDINVSQYILGYTIGIEFASHDLIYTEIMNEKEPYEGKYLYTNKDASSFESYLAKMGDYLATYEFEKYEKQSLISFINSAPQSIESKSSTNENEDFEENTIDVENIKRKKRFKTGIVASYNIYPSYTQMNQYQENLEYYFESINQNHKIPVIISEYAIPSSRVSNDFSKDKTKGYINEEEQGELLVEVYDAIEKSNCAGSFIMEFKDNWSRSSSNTKDSIILDRSVYWSDTQTYAQNFGLMAFDPGEDESISYTDGSINEWGEEDIISENKDTSLSVKSDEKYLYFMVKSKDNIDFTKKRLYLDLDITPKSGSDVSSKLDLKFERPVDFIIDINGINNSRVYIHEYYNDFNFYKNKKDNQKRPDLISHKPDMDEFSEIYMEISPKMYVESLNKFVDAVDYETGKLVHGNSNPESEQYNSASDFYMGDDYVEIRIPWALLNFMDPSTKQIKDDIYDNFNIEPLMINNINIGLTIKEDDKVINRIKSSEYDLDSWIMPKYHERLKESYYILKEKFTKG